jgi:hypothetical protein
VVIEMTTKAISHRHLAWCDAAVNVLSYPELALFETNIPEALYHPLKHHRNSSQ